MGIKRRLKEQICEPVIASVALAWLQRECSVKLPEILGPWIGSTGQVRLGDAGVLVHGPTWAFGQTFATGADRSQRVREPHSRDEARWRPSSNFQPKLPSHQFSALMTSLRHQNIPAVYVVHCEKARCRDAGLGTVPTEASYDVAARE
ncbi:hypothetical protein VTK56DRAFT_6175 [Thermocarpiscus australiensis]